MDNTTLKPRELCNIIKACREAGVSKLKLGSIELEFYKSDSYSPLELPLFGHSPTKIKESKAAAKETPLQMHLLPEQEEELKEELHAHLLIDDPSSFEEQMIYENLSAATLEGERNGPNHSRPRENLS